jgi:hypothetical protein
MSHYDGPLSANPITATRRLAIATTAVSEAPAAATLARPQRSADFDRAGCTQSFSRRDPHAATVSPLLMSACTSPSIMKVGDTWIPF